MHLIHFFLFSPWQAVNLANIEGNTPLHWACVNNQNAAVRILMQAGANASALNTHENTPVDEALIREYQDLVDTINEFSSKTVAGGNGAAIPGIDEEIDDVPDDAEEVAGGEGGDDDVLMGEQVSK
jgi:ankyrin repeat protein